MRSPITNERLIEFYASPRSGAAMFRKFARLTIRHSNLAVNRIAVNQVKGQGMLGMILFAALFLLIVFGGAALLGWMPTGSGQQVARACNAAIEICTNRLSCQ